MCPTGWSSRWRAPQPRWPAPKPFDVTVEGRFLYGAPGQQSGHHRRPSRSQAADGRAGFDGYQFGAADDDEAKAAIDQMLEDLPTTDAGRQGQIPGHHREIARHDAAPGGAGHASAWRSRAAAPSSAR